MAQRDFDSVMARALDDGANIGGIMPDPAKSSSTLWTRVADLAKRWDLEVGTPFPPTPGSPGNFVAPAMRKDGSPCVLKVARAVEDTRSEIAALRLWNGRGAARLLASDAARAGMLLERVAPGTMLAEVAERDDDAATRIAAGLLRELWQPAEAADGLQCEVSQPTEAADGLQCELWQPTVAGDGLQCEVWQPAATADGLQPLEMWCAAYDRNRAALLAGVAGFPRALFERADALRADLLSSTQEPVVLHG
ncbi:MAG TPA: aminoglycoside phosphotransferase family protein, partial [Chloroflexota bacterium]